MMNFISISIVSVLLVEFVTSQKCGLSALSGRIFGGVTYPQCEWPFSPMVSLRFFFPNYPDYTNGNLTLCAGAILNRQTILTTAVCAGFINTFSENQQSQAAVVVGEYDTRTTDTDPGNPALIVEEMKYIAAVRIHPGYDRSTLANNLAILRLTSQIQYHKCKVPACMPDRASPSDDCLQIDDSCMMAAWGTSNVQDEFSNPIPLKQNLTLFSRSVSEAIVDYVQSYLPAGSLIGRPPPGVKACFYDWGGLVVCRNPNTQRYILRGLVGTSNCFLDEDAPVLVVDLAQFTDWINQCDLNINSCPQLQ